MFEATQKAKEPPWVPLTFPLKRRNWRLNRWKAEAERLARKDEILSYKRKTFHELTRIKLESNLSSAVWCFSWIALPQRRSEFRLKAGFQVGPDQLEGGSPKLYQTKGRALARPKIIGADERT